MTLHRRASYPIGFVQVTAMILFNKTVTDNVRVVKSALYNYFDLCANESGEENIW